MIELKRVPVLRVLIPFTAGSLPGFGSVVPAGIYTVLILTAILGILMVAAFIFLRKRPVFLSGFFCLTAFIFFGVAGYGTGMLVRPRDPGLPEDRKVMVMGDILEDARPANRSWMTGMHLRLVVSADSGYVTNTIVKLYLEMPSDSALPAPGEIWQFFGTLSAIRNSGNPGEPDYRRILGRNNCWYRFYAGDLPVLNHRVQGREHHGMRHAMIRSAISDRWEGDPEELSLLKAVCLGDRSGLTAEMEHDFSHAGGMHILAVSGLHVGLIWWVLYHTLSVLVRITRREASRTLLIVLILWIYAWITGFASPVCRSVTMFSLLTLGRLLDQRSSTLNGILVSAFLLIFLDPGRILDVGFQLSYSAVLGIVTLQPRFREWLPARNRMLRWVRDATGVSIAAQVATGPLVAYYFHQLPTCAILTNLVAIPLLSCIIALFVISTPFFAAGCCTWLFNWPLNRLSAALNRTMEFIGSLPGAVIGDLHPDRTVVFLILILILLIIFILHDRRNLFRYLLMVQLAVILCWTSWSRYRTNNSPEFVAAHFYGGSLLIFREGTCVDYYMWVRDSIVANRMQRYMETSWDYRRYQLTAIHMNGLACGKGSVTVCHSLCRGAWQVGNDRFRGVVLSGGFDPERLPVLVGRDWDFILLSGEPRINLLAKNRLLSRENVIVDGSNRGWFTAQLDPTRGTRSSAERGPQGGARFSGQPHLPGGSFHLTGQRGAYVRRR